MLSRKTGKRILVFLITNFILYLTACFVLIYWPVPVKKEIRNYDYSSIKRKSPNTLASEKRLIKVRDDYDLATRIYHSENKDVLILIQWIGLRKQIFSKFSRFIS